MLIPLMPRKVATSAPPRSAWPVACQSQWSPQTRRPRTEHAAKSGADRRRPPARCPHGDSVGAGASDSTSTKDPKQRSDAKPETERVARCLPASGPTAARFSGCYRLENRKFLFTVCIRVNLG